MDWLFRIPYLPQNGAAEYGDNIDWILHLVAHIVAPWVVLTFGLIILFSILYYRRRENQGVYVDSHAPLFSIAGIDIPRTAIIEVPTMIVLGLDMWIFFASIAVWADVKQEVPETDVKVMVQAYQFDWEFFYPGPDGKLDTKDDLRYPEMHIPQGKDVKLLIKSKDVIHSMFVPHLRFKQDAVPGRTIEGWLNAKTPTRPTFRERKITGGLDSLKSKIEKENKELASSFENKTETIDDRFSVKLEIPSYTNTKEDLQVLKGWLEEQSELDSAFRSECVNKIDELLSITDGIIKDRDKYDGFFPRFAYELVCAELCGINHSGMKNMIYVHSPDVYQQWKEEMLQY